VPVCCISVHHHIDSTGCSLCVVYRRVIHYVQTWFWGCAIDTASINFKAVIFRATENPPTDSDQRTHHYSVVSVSSWRRQLSTVLPGVCTHGRVVSIMAPRNVDTIVLCELKFVSTIFARKIGISKTPVALSHEFNSRLIPF